MHDRRKLREGLAARLKTEIGVLVGDRVYAGRLAALDAGTELPAIMVDVARSKAVLFDQQNSALRRAYEATVTILVRGPDTDLAEPEESYADILDELALQVEVCLARESVLYDKLGLRLIDWLFVDDVASAKGPLAPGAIASLTLRYHAVLVHADGNPSS